MNMRATILVSSLVFLLMEARSYGQENNQLRSLAENPPLISAEIMPQDTSGAPPSFVPVDVQPQIVAQPIPKYPEEAVRGGIEGRIIVKVWVSKEGKPRKAVVLKRDLQTADVQSHSEGNVTGFIGNSNRGVTVALTIFDQPSIDAALATRFTPASLKDKPVDVWVVIPYTFKLNRTDGSLSDTLIEASQKLNELANRLAKYSTLLEKSAIDSISYSEAAAKLREAMKNYEDYKVQAEFYSQYAKEMLRQAKLYMEKAKELQKEK